MELDATALYVLRGHDGLPEIYGAAPTARSAAEKYFDRQIAVIGSILEDGRPFRAGDELSKADIMLGSCCLWAKLGGLDLPSAVERGSAPFDRAIHSSRHSP